MEKAVLEALGDKKPEEVANQTITCIIPPLLPYNSYKTYTLREPYQQMWLGLMKILRTFKN